MKTILLLLTLAQTLDGRGYEEEPLMKTMLSYIDLHALELLCTVTIAAYVLNYFWGRLINKRLAMGWLDAVRHPIAENFSVVGRATRVSTSNQVQFE
jgi:hypothetical protein